MECASEATCIRRDKEICYLGWILLFLWLVMIIYITKEVWFGTTPLATPKSSCLSINSIKNSENCRKENDEVVTELD